MKDYRELQEKKMKKIKFIAFFYIPFLFFISLILGSLIAEKIGFKIEIRAILFVIGVLIIVYLITIKSFIEKARKKDSVNQVSSEE